MSYNAKTNMYDGYIYKATNIVNGKVYIGQTSITVEHRWNEHLKGSKNERDQYAFHRAIRKYGESKFIVETVVKTSEKDPFLLKAELNKIEKIYIKGYDSFGKNGYNMTPGGDGWISKPVVLYGHNGKFIAEYSSMYDAAYANGISVSSISACCNGRYGGTRCGVFRYKREPFDKYKMTYHGEDGSIEIILIDFDDNEIKKYKSMSAVAREYGVTKTTVSRWIKDKRVIDYQYIFVRTDRFYRVEERTSFIDYRINKYDMSGKYIKTYPSAGEAGRENNTDASSIIKCCTGKVNHIKGFIYRRYKEYSDCNDIDVIFKNKRKNRPKKEKIILSEEEKIKKRLDKIGYCGEVDVYNSFGELVFIFDNIIEAAKHFKTTTSEILKSCNGENLKLKRHVVRYHGDSFNKFPRSKSLQPITVYNLQGEIVGNFETIVDAENFVGCTSGEITKTINRGGTYKDYMFSYYGEPLTRKIEKQIKKIEMCDDKFNCIQLFNSKKEISKFFGYADKHKEINDVIKNKEKWMGYYWKYQDEFKVNM